MRLARTRLWRARRRGWPWRRLGVGGHLRGNGRFFLFFAWSPAAAAADRVRIQDVSHSDREARSPSSESTSRSTGIRKWPVLRCRLMAAFGCPPKQRSILGKTVKTQCRRFGHIVVVSCVWPSSTSSILTRRLPHDEQVRTRDRGMRIRIRDDLRAIGAQRSRPNHDYRRARRHRPHRGARRRHVHRGKRRLDVSVHPEPERRSCARAEFQRRAKYDHQLQLRHERRAGTRQHTGHQRDNVGRCGQHVHRHDSSSEHEGP